MAIDIRLLPDMILFNDYGSWDAYVADLYSVFKRDFIDSKPRVGSVVFKLKYHPEYQERAYTFYHMTHKGDNEAERLPDLRRSERLPWCRHTIEKTDVYRLRFWEETRKEHSRICIWLEAETCGKVEIENNYFVILEVRNGYVLPWTAFCADKPHQLRKKHKEYEQWLKDTGDKKCTLEGLIVEIMKKKQGTHDNHTTP